MLTGEYFLKERIQISINQNESDIDIVTAAFLGSFAIHVGYKDYIYEYNLNRSHAITCTFL